VPSPPKLKKKIATTQIIAKVIERIGQVFDGGFFENLKKRMRNTYFYLIFGKPQK
jgi:hypothetical protein